MTQVARNADRKAKWMRRIARVLAVIWAIRLTVGWTFSLLLYAMSYEYYGGDLQSAVWQWLFLLLVAWVPPAVAWRWEAVGGVALLVAGVFRLGEAFSSDWFPLAWRVLDGHAEPNLVVSLLVCPFVGNYLFPAGLALAAGSLFLASWRKSRTPAPPQASE